MTDYKLGFIGAGNMAEAILRGVIGAGLFDPAQIIAADPSAQRRETLKRDLNIHVSDDNQPPASCGRMVLAVKPQVIDEVLSQIAKEIRQDTLVISIAAGVTASHIDAGLGGKCRIVRVMPNTPMLVGAGVSAVAAGPRATSDDVDYTLAMFSASGEAVRVQEDMMDAVTAVSGSGPAYFFYLVEAMVDAGCAEGLERATAMQLARQTCLGAGKLLAETGEDPAELRRRVTSPGGTTQRAIETLDAADARQIITRAVRAAAERSRELGS